MSTKQRGERGLVRKEGDVQANAAKEFDRRLIGVGNLPAWPDGAIARWSNSQRTKKVLVCDSGASLGLPTGQQDHQFIPQGLPSLI